MGFEIAPTQLSLKARSETTWKCLGFMFRDSGNAKDAQRGSFPKIREPCGPGRRTFSSEVRTQSGAVQAAKQQLRLAER